MNTIDKAVAEMHKAGLYSAHIAGGEGDIGVYVDCWNQDLEFTLSIRVHEEEINYYANQYDKNNETK
jgi:hypothetical protein